MPSSGMSINIILVFFIYGLAFFSMGLAMMLESGRSPLLAEGRVLRPLAIFGFSHGTHEWLELLLEQSRGFEVSFSTQVAWMRLGLLAISFTSLIVFGIRVLRPQKRLSLEDLTIVVGLVCLYVVLILGGLAYREPGADRLLYADVLARYILAIPGAALAALALLCQASGALQAERRSLAARLRMAGASFALYCLTQAFVPALDFFPANSLNTAVFLNLTGIPIQVVRAVLAVAITASLIRAIQAVDEERQSQYLAVQQARLDALEQVQRELEQREALRRELLRHTVVAQEEERARIARELHDETAQVLTAFSLNLAALRDLTPGTPRVGELISRLQGLSRQMSDGLYRLVHDLRPAQLDDLGLAAALQYLADEERRRTGLEVCLQVQGDRQRLDPLVETVFFRVAQEALTNVARHARASQVEVLLQFSPQQVRLRISDQGAGFDVQQNPIPPHGWGLAGMRERADSIGARLHIQSAHGQGTVVELEALTGEALTGEALTG